VGTLFAVGFLFKVPVVFDAFGIGLWLLFFENRDYKIKRLVLLMVGFVVPVLASMVYFWVKGAGAAYISAAFLQNAAYLSSWSNTNNSGLMVRGGVAIFVTILILLFTKKEKKENRLVFVWLVWALFGSLLSERPYPHYLMQIVAPGALLIGLILENKRRPTLLVGGLLIVLVTLSIFKYNFYFYPVAKYYQNFYKYITKQNSLNDYYLSFDNRVLQTYEVAQYLKSRTENSETIFIWGDEPLIYALADRLPPGRFTVAYHIVDFGGQTETIEAIKEKEPKYIVVMQSEKRKFDDLFSIISADYSDVSKIREAIIYRRVK
jgi:hypothetical protein